MARILINFAHPMKSRSTINRALLSVIQDLDQVTVNDLYDHYPDFMIDVEREQRLCEEHDVIIFQHPFYWYSTPSIVKEWLDLVLQHGWAYGSTGDALSGKLFLQAMSAGGDASTYTKDGYNGFTFAELTSPMRATANLCKMTWLPPFVVAGVHRGLPKEQVQAHANDYHRVVTALRDDRLDLEHVLRSETLNSDLNQAIKGQ
ncbi:NAD(P)H-dependent oxidoreductase [Algisphaera agarilytica]|uniref:Glutathione-regulated potassium-efflux system ancillary protein KefG n=1 Tax=Algisphaera agarilytica TaxID=1385975 RepID=A0A7X0H898_9BACT|nr:NAD(P)H-dependent oxidoreductase [Algisphaera agarilytica]MBB6431120.1 glutathione-regulated potassium-efflux system ancillary protein KefG [Algisphaera agarilytica]